MSILLKISSFARSPMNWQQLSCFILYCFLDIPPDPACHHKIELEKLYL